MLRNKVIVKKSKKGNLMRIVREHYLRDDIWCSSDTCSPNICNLKTPPVLVVTPSTSSRCRDPHFIVPDLNVVWHQIDVLDDDAICNVIIAQTVLDEVRHRNTAAYKRVKDIVGINSRHFYIFSNEFHVETFVEREVNETKVDRNSRAVRQVALWYQSHLGGQNSKVKILFLSDDAESRAKAQACGLLAFSTEEYVESLEGCGVLLDKLARVNTENLDLNKQSKADLYPDHVSLAEVQKGIVSGRYVQGSFVASRENFLEANVNVEGREDMVFLQGRRHLNRAVHDDVVAIEMLPEEEWTCPSSLVLEDKTHDVTDDKQEEEEELEMEKQRKENAVPTAKVVAIIKRKWRQYCGILEKPRLIENTRHLFIPAEKKIPKVRIETRQAEALQGQRIVVAIDSWPKNSRYPQGHFVRKLGEIGDKDTENQVLLLEHDVPHSNFSQAVLNCLPSLPWLITEEDEQARVDLRSKTICSVDPPGCTDIDDALHCEQLANGNFEVGVHIADVSHFIRPGTALDAEAASRGTTVYLVDKRIDMVPELLSSNLCSLRGGEQRFAFSCVWEMRGDAKIVSTKFMKSIIESKAAMTYAEAQLVIDDKSKQGSLALGLRQLNKLAKVLRQRRMDNGALLLASTEIRFEVDSETHDPVDVETKQLRDTNSMVEEFMLLANISVAEHIYKNFPHCAVLRRHPAPPASNFDPLIKVAENKGFKLDVNSNGALAKSLDAAVLPHNPYFNTMLRILTTRCMMQAVYFSSGMINEVEFMHYGLATPIYTHFTSPIRRYSDILVHRLLAVTVRADSTYPDLLDKNRAQKICNNLNYRHKMAQYAGRASVALHTQLFFKERVQDEDGYVLFLRKNALQVMIPKYGLEGTLYLKDDTGNSLFEFDEEKVTQTAGDVVIRAFDPVTVQVSIDRTNVQRQRMQLKLVRPKIPDFSVPPQHKRKDTNEEIGMKRRKKI